MALKHECYSNCQSCGLIFCVEEEQIVSQHGCYVCKNGRPVSRPLTSQQLGGGVTSEERAAYALKDKLLQFDLENAKRSHVHDAQADYYETATWLTEEEKLAIDARQKARREALQPSSRRRFLNVHIGSGGGRADSSFKKSVEEDGQGSEEEEATAIVNVGLSSNKSHAGELYRRMMERRCEYD